MDLGTGSLDLGARSLDLGTRPLDLGTMDVRISGGLGFRVQISELEVWELSILHDLLAKRH